MEKLKVWYREVSKDIRIRKKEILLELEDLYKTESEGGLVEDQATHRLASKQA